VINEGLRFLFRRRSKINFNAFVFPRVCSPFRFPQAEVRRESASSRRGGGLNGARRVRNGSGNHEVMGVDIHAGVVMYFALVDSFGEALGAYRNVVCDAFRHLKQRIVGGVQSRKSGNPLLQDFRLFS